MGITSTAKKYVKKAFDIFVTCYDKTREIMQMFTPIPLPDPLRICQKVLKKITG